jgi:aryl carrier-like protein
MQSRDHEDPVGANGERPPAPEAIVNEQAYAAPRTSLEEQLCTLWSAVSLVDRVGIHDDFFQIGGDSIAAVHLLARMRKTFSVDVPLSRFLDSPTIAGMASWLEEVLQGGPKAPSIPTRYSGKVRALSFVQEQIWSAAQVLNRLALYNCPVFLRLTGVLDVPVLEAGLNEIVRRHEVLRSRFCVADGRPGLAPDHEWHLRLDAEDLRMLPEQERATETECRALAALRMPFDLVQGPLLGASLLRTDDREHVLLLVFHHSIFDGLSVEILFRELCALYEAFAAGRPSPVCRFCLMAEESMARYGHGKNKILLDQPTRRTFAVARTSHHVRTPRRTEPQGATDFIPSSRGTGRRITNARATGRRDTFHGNARRIPGVACSVHWTGRPVDRHPC